MEPIDDYLEHHGVKGMKWGVRRTPEQLGHHVVSGAKKVAGGVRKAKTYMDEREAAKKKKIVDTALASRSKKDISKAMRYMSDDDLKKLADRQQLEQRVMSNAGSQKGGAPTGTGNKIRRALGEGTADVSKDVYKTFATEAVKPTATAIGKAAGQAFLSEASKVAINAAAKKYGIDAKTASSVAESFKTVMAEDFAAVSKSQREKFVQKNNLGEEWERAKARKTAEKATQKTNAILDVASLMADQVSSSRSSADREAAAYRAGKKAGKKAAKKAAKKNKKNQTID